MDWTLSYPETALERIELMNYWAGFFSCAVVLELHGMETLHG